MMTATRNTSHNFARVAFMAASLASPMWLIWDHCHAYVPPELTLLLRKEQIEDDRRWRMHETEIKGWPNK